MSVLPNLPEGIDQFFNDPVIARYAKYYENALSYLERDMESDFAQFQLQLLENSAQQIVSRIEVLHLVSIFEEERQKWGRINLVKGFRKFPRKKANFYAA